jgi:hypothetical protein
MYQRDKHHRPVCYYDVDKLKDLQDKPAVMTDSILHMLNYAMEHLLVPGHVEQWITIINLENVALTSIPVTALK